MRNDFFSNLTLLGYKEYTNIDIKRVIWMLCKYYMQRYRCGDSYYKSWLIINVTENYLMFHMLRRSTAWFVPGWNKAGMEKHSLVWTGWLAGSQWVKKRTPLPPESHETFSRSSFDGRDESCWLTCKSKQGVVIIQIQAGWRGRWRGASWSFQFQSPNTTTASAKVHGWRHICQLCGYCCGGVLWLLAPHSEKSRGSLFPSHSVKCGGGDFFPSHSKEAGCWCSFPHWLNIVEHLQK